jgi:hypothetical protein
MAKWSSGQSGNPGGRPKGYGDLRELAREHTEEALQVLISVMQEETAPASARVSAAQHLLDRGWGRPEASINVTSPGRSWVDEVRAMQERLSSAEKQPPEATGSVPGPLQAKAALPS